ncbi:MAG: excinuclease ABC subunit C, partial [Pseudomonadota bacterium]
MNDSQPTSDDDQSLAGNAPGAEDTPPAEDAHPAEDALLEGDVSLAGNASLAGDAPPAGTASLAGAELIKAKIRTLPNSPGVYRMLDAKGDALYVGKAKS